MFGSRRTSEDHGRVAVVGLGRFGTSLALTLAERGVEVLAVDSDPRRVQEVGEEITHAVVADSTDVEALRQVGIHEYTHAVVAIGADIEASILTTTLLAEMQIPDLWAKALTATHGRILSKVGAAHVVYPEKEMGRKVGNMVTGSLLDYVELDDEMALVKAHPPAELVGTTLDLQAVERRSGLRVVAYRRAQRGYRAPEDGLELRRDDVVVLSGTPEKIREFSQPR